MKKKAPFAVIIAIAVTAIGFAAVAYAVEASRGDAWTVTGKVAPKAGGTIKAPVGVATAFTMDETAANGYRPNAPLAIGWKWTGVFENGGQIPKCSPAAVSAAKSNSVCPKGSAVGTVTLIAKLGAAGGTPPGVLLANSATCAKSAIIYNAGAGKSFWWVYGPGSACAGVAYLPPILLSWKKTAGGSIGTLTLPGNIREPLPGVEGGFVNLNVKYNKVTAKVKGKKVAYLQSICKQGTKRAFTFYSTEPTAAGIVGTSVPLGKCG